METALQILELIVLLIIAGIVLSAFGWI